MLINPVNSEQHHSHNPDHEPKFRVATPAEVESADGELPGGKRKLYMPVALNPLLQWVDVTDHWGEANQADRYGAVFSTNKHLAQLAQYGVSRATFVTDPPCREIKSVLYYNVRPSRPGLYSLMCYVDVKSDQPLTIGDAINHALKSKRVWTQETYKDHNALLVEDLTAAERIDELEKKHNCKLVLEGLYTVLAFNDIGARPLIITDADYLRYKPKVDEVSEDEPADGDSLDDESSDDDSSDKDSADNDSSEDELAEGEPTQEQPQ
jgi:hypothetical protein